jgi:hypothetical protein
MFYDCYHALYYFVSDSYLGKVSNEKKVLSKLQVSMKYACYVCMKLTGFVKISDVIMPKRATSEVLYAF